MSQTLTIHGVEYIPAGEAGKRFGYTRDYMLTLSREGKIDGQKVGHRWYINPQSAEVFFTHAEIHREERRKIISLERKAELREHSGGVKGSGAHTALFETCAILVLGLSIGLVGYVGMGVDQRTATAAVTDADDSFFEELAISFYEFISPRASLSVYGVSTTDESASSTETDMSPEVVVKSDSSDVPAMIVAPVSDFSTTSVARIQEAFSDPVSVSIDPEDSNTGIIVPTFKDGDGEAYRFLLVPVNATPL